jgi:hypothetical protein
MHGPTGRALSRHSFSNVRPPDRLRWLALRRAEERLYYYPGSPREPVTVQGGCRGSAWYRFRYPHAMSHPLAP